MDASIAKIVARIRDLQHQLEAEANKLRTRFHYSVKGREILFERDIVLYHRKLRKGLLRFLREAQVSSILTAPMIYAMVVPIAFLDLSVTIYQHICFRAYGLPRVRRADYVVIDRHHLAYLNVIEKFNCAYCGYGNGVIAYAREVSARTEQYWCPIKHARQIKGSHEHYLDFIEYGDAENLLENWEKIREKIKKE